MEFGPIWRSILRNKSGYVLIALQIAVTMALMVNAVSIIQERTRLKERPTGVDEPNIFTLTSTSFDPDSEFRSLVAEDLDAIRSHPGVQAAVMTNSLPIRNGGWGQELQLEPGQDKESFGSAIYFVDEFGVDAFGVNLIAGRNITSADVDWFDTESDDQWPPVAVVTRALVDSMFPDVTPAEAVGKTVYIANTDPVQIVGVIEKMQAPWPGWDDVEHASLIPLKRGDSFARYVIRSEPGQLDEIIPDIEAMLAERYQGRIIRSPMTMAEIRQRAYQEHNAMISMLMFIGALLTAITSLGIVGLASFSVARRTRQIGTRRALGATRPAILRYFLLENFLISSVGIAGGAVLAIALNLWMVDTFNLAPMAWYVIPGAMLMLWLVGQLAVYGPARRASKISPAIATRTV